MKNILSIIVFLLSVTVFGQSPNENYVKTRVHRYPNTGTGVIMDTLVTVKYFDGLGRPKQLVQVKAGGNNQDIVTPFVYDVFGRKVKKYLSYAHEGQTVPSLNYRNNGDLIEGINLNHIAKFPGELTSSNPNPFNETVYESSPLSRVIKEASPGSSWAAVSGNNDHNAKFDYQSNSLNEVRKFGVSFSSENGVEDVERTILTYKNYYGPGKLLKFVSKDENWTPADGNDKTIEEFKDQDGQVILKRTYNNGVAHDTYFVYDRFDNLTYIIPPLAADQIVKSTTVGGIFTFNLPWTALARVDEQLAKDYEHELEDYKNEDILNADLYDKYNGAGGISVTTDTDGNMALTINITTGTTLPYRTGKIADLSSLGTFTDRELGRIALKDSIQDYQYIFTVKDNALVVSGSGNVPSLNTTLSGEAPLEYSTNYAFTKIAKIDPVVAANYEASIASLPNSQILNTYTPNNYGAMGGVSVSVGSDDSVTVSVNITSDTPLELSTGASIPLNLQRKILDQDLGGANGYQFKILNNSLVVIGSGPFTNLTFYSFREPVVKYSIKTEVLEGLCYIYHFDLKNRLIEKHVPDNGWTHMVYDKQDRVILTQSQNLRAKTAKNWMFNKYDKFGRVVYTGEYTNLNGRKSIQDYINSAALPLNEQRSTVTTFTSGNATIYYTNDTYPTDALNVLNVRYYDDYVNYTLPTTIYTDVAIETNTKNLPTVDLSRVLDTNYWITTIVGYDNKGRTIYQKSYELDYLKVKNTIETSLSFDGKVSDTKTTHEKLNPSNTWVTTTLLDSYSDDFSGRPVRHVQKINNLGYNLISWNLYDELGKIKEKSVGGSYYAGMGYGMASLQTINYKYNIRGWLTGINNTADNLTTADDLFAFKISYNTPGQAGSTPLYNGNVSETVWKSKTDNLLKTYVYQYDDLSRLLDANYSETGNSIDKYKEGSISYDKNGNILSLERKGLKNGTTNTFVITDALTYQYKPLSNQLLSVSDVAGIEGFNNGSTGTNTDYTYDVSGNMTTDANKDIVEILYNHFNLPTKITFANNNKIEYIYDSKGVKLIKKVTNAGVETVTQYTGNFVYQNNVLKYFSNPEGYVDCDGGTYTYVYQYKDHLDNVRLSYKGTKGDLTVLEQNHFYPFGLKQQTYGEIINSTNIALKYKYQGQERQDELGLNWDSFKWRNYDYAIARFMSVDPLSEDYNYQTVYAFAGNEPLVGRELEGLENQYSKRLETRTDVPVVSMPQNSSLQPMPNAKNESIDRNYLIKATADIIQSVSDNTYEDFGATEADTAEVGHAAINTTLITNIDSTFKGNDLITAGELSDSFDDDDFSIQFSVEIVSVDQELTKPGTDFSTTTNASTTAGTSVSNSTEVNASGGASKGEKWSGNGSVGIKSSSTTTENSGGTVTNGVSQNKTGAYQVHYRISVTFKYDQDSLGVSGSTGKTTTLQTPVATGILITPVPMTLTNQANKPK